MSSMDSIDFSAIESRGLTASAATFGAVSSIILSVSRSTREGAVMGAVERGVGFLGLYCWTSATMVGVLEREEPGVLAADTAGDGIAVHSLMG